MKIANAVKLILLPTVVGLSVLASALDPNVALGKSVTGSGTFFTGGWGAGQTVSFDTVTDGLVFADSHQWDQGPVWWDETRVKGSCLIIDLGGLYDLSGFAIQADNNDEYLIDASMDGMNWGLAWKVPVVGGWGVKDSSTTLGSTVTARYLRICGQGGDELYAVSELQAFGQVVPEPATGVALLCGLLAVSRRRRRA
jgi:hypothetical protein